MTIRERTPALRLAGLTILVGLLSGCGVAQKRGEARSYLQDAYEDYQQGDYEGCIYGTSKALVRAPNHAEAYLLRAYAELELHNFSNALVDVHAALSIRPDAAPFLLARARVYQKLDDMEAALVDADRAVALQDNLDTVGTRLDLRGRAGDAAGVAEDLHRLAEMGPDDPGCLNARAWSMMMYLDEAERDSEEILAMAERGVELTERNDAAVLDTLACALFDVGRRDEALATLREALGKEMAMPNRKELDRHLIAFEAGEDWRQTQE